MHEIGYAGPGDIGLLAAHDRHISEAELAKAVAQDRILVMRVDGEFVGWLRFGMFWDSIPFMNMLYILDGHRGNGLGRELVGFWEREMRGGGFGRVMTSTQSDEQAQFFYRKIGYKECGALLLPGEPLKMIFIKDLT